MAFLVGYKGSIHNSKKKGKILVVVGYHYEEKLWGLAIEKAFKKMVKDENRHLVFCKIKNKEICGGDPSLASEREINEVVEREGGWENFEAIIDIHDHHKTDGDYDDVKLWLGDKLDPDIFRESLETLPRGGKEDYDQTEEFHIRVSKDGWPEEFHQYNLCERKIPTLLFDSRIDGGEILKYLVDEIVPTERLSEALYSHLHIMKMFSNLVLCT